MQTIENWNNFNSESGADVFKYVKFPTVQCTAAHFGNSTRSKELFDSWAGFSLLCPDIKMDQKIKLYGQFGDMETKHFSFKVNKCQNTTENGNHCHPSNEIDQYVHDASMRVWVIQRNAEMGQLSTNPYYVS